MKWSARISYFLAGVCFTNAVPHLVIAATGRRNLTPFGRDSSPEVNLLWSGINFASGYLLVREADRHTAESSANATTWLVPYEAGRFCWSLFGVSYALVTNRSERSKGRTKSPLRRLRQQTHAKEHAREGSR